MTIPLTSSIIDAVGGDPTARANQALLRRPRRLIAAIGDSRVAQSIQVGASNGGVTNRKKPHGTFPWLDFLSHGQVACPSAYNYGVSGSLVSDLAGQLASVLALSPLPTDVAILSGTNSFSAGTSAATAWSQYSAVLQTLENAGINPIVICDLPRRLGSWTAANSQQSNQFNELLRRNAPAYGANVVSAAYLLADPADTNGDPLAGYYQNNNSGDNGIHPAVLGGYNIGRAILAAISPLIQPGLPTFGTRADMYNATDNPYGNILEAVVAGSSLFQGTSGTNTSSGGTASGTVASGWNNRTLTGTGTSVASIVARADGYPGNYQQLVQTSGSGVSTYRYSFITNPAVSTYYSVGDILQLAADINVSSATGLERFDLLISDFNGSVQLGFSQWGDLALIGANQFTFPANFSGMALTDPVTTITGSTGLLIRLETQVNNGAATIQIGGARLRRL